MVEKKEQQFGIERKKIKRNDKNKTIRDYKQLKARYINEGTKVYLEIPSFQLLNNIDFLPVVSLKINGKEIFNKELEIKESGSGILVATKKEQIDLSNFYGLSGFNLNNVELTINHAGDEIYNSKTSLFRSFILFNNKGNEITSNVCIPGEYYAFIINLNLFSKYPNEIYKSDHFFYNIEAKEGESFQYESRFIFFDNEKKSHDLLITGQILQNVKYIEDGEEYLVVDGEIYIELTKEINELEYGIKYGDCCSKLVEFNKTIESNEHKKFTISNLVDVGKPCKISLFKYSTNEIVQTLNFIKFNNIKIKFDKDLYYDEEHEGKVEFITDKFYEEASFNINDEEIFLKFNNGELEVYPPQLKWRIDNGSFSNVANTKMWWKELTNSSILEISAPKDMNIKVYSSNSTNTEIARVGNENKFKIGQLVHSVALNSNSLLPNIQIYTVINDKNKLIANIYLKENFMNPPIYVDEQNKRIHWNKSTFIGDKNKKLFMKIKQNDKNKIIPYELKSEKSNIDVGKLDDGFYKLSIVSDEIKGFAHHEQVIYETDIALGNKKNLRFLNKTLCVSKAMFFDKIGLTNIKPFYIDNIKYLATDVAGFDIYKGQLFFKKNHYEKNYAYAQRNKNGESVQINPIRIEIIRNNYLFIGYGLDENDPEFEYDNEFCVNKELEITINVQKGVTNNVDYYYFEEVK